MALNRIFIAGHGGMVGSAILRVLQGSNSNHILTASRSELDLLSQAQVNDWFAQNKPTQVYLAAAKVGGIYANNSFPAEFIYENLMIESNVINAAHLNGVQKILFLGSSCIYPKNSDQPIKEEALLTGVLESTNEPYAIAKIAGIKLCESYNRQYGRDYRSIMPTNLYGPNDNYHPDNSHVIPALIRRIHAATIQNLPEVSIWGSGKPMREFLHVDDLATACVHLMNLDSNIYNKISSPMNSHINVGSSVDCTIREVAETLARIIGYQGALSFDTSKPDGTFRKLMDSTRIRNLGWKPTYNLEDGLRHTYKSYLESLVEL